HVYIRFISLHPLGLRQREDYRGESVSRSQIERILVRTLILNLTRSGLHIPINVLHAINADVTASRLGSHRAIDLVQFNIPRASVDANVPASFRFYADVSAAGLCRKRTRHLSALHVA